MVSQIVVSLVKCLRGDRILYGTKRTDVFGLTMFIVIQNRVSNKL